MIRMVRVVKVLGCFLGNVVWSVLVLKDSQYYLVSEFLVFDGFSDNSYVVYANILWKNEISRLSRITQCPFNNHISIIDVTFSPYSLLVNLQFRL